MANVVMNTKFQLRNDTKTNWTTQNPILLKGEIGIEIDTKKFKIGDGVKTWSALEYASSQPALLSTNNPTITDSGYDIGSLWVNTSSDKAFLLYDNTAGNAAWKQVVILNESGKIDNDLLDSIAITDIFEVSSQSEMISLAAQQGDVAVRSDLSRSFILKQDPASILSNWVELKTPTDVVTSVNGETGAVTLTTSHISEGSNMYYTEARATANFNTNFLSKSSSDLNDGSTILHSSDTLILSGGTSGGW